MGDSTDAPMAVDDTLPMADAGEPPPMRCGRYTVIGPLGAGGMGVVLSAYDPDLDRKVAIKLLRHEAPIEREAKAMAKLAHPNVVTVFEVDRVGDRTFVAMELVDGTTLRGWLQEQQRSWREIVDMFVVAGEIMAPSNERRVPHRVYAALRRGIAVEPAARWPDLERRARPVRGPRRTTAIRGHRLADARVALDRALGLPEATTDPFQRALARAYLGWVNIASGRDVSGGRAAIVATRKVIAEDSEGHETLDEIDRWLAGSR